MKLAEHKRVQLIWVLGYRGIDVNETTDQLARLGSQYPLLGPDIACSISLGIAKKAVWDWTNRDHKKYWETLTELKHAKGFLQGSSARRTRKLLKVNTN